MEEDLLKRIVIDPNVMNGKPVIRGTRLTVQCILKLMAYGSTIDEILHKYDELTQEDIGACIRFAAKATNLDFLLSGGVSMTEYIRDQKRVDKVLRKIGVVVVMGKDHAKKSEDVVNTVKAIYEAGLVAEVTFRIDERLLREAMSELTKMRAESDPENPMVLGVGSVINPHELETAIEMGFDMAVSPDSGMGGYREKVDFVKITRSAKVFGAPAGFSPSEFSYWIEREDGFEPDAVKIFNSSVYGPKNLGGLLAPYQRDRHTGRIIMPTGGVDRKTGPEFQKNIKKYGFFPVLGMSDPLSLVLEKKMPGDPDILRESLAKFKEEFTANIKSST